MTLVVTHPKVLPGPDDDDPNTVSPTDWNVAHTIAGSVAASEITSPAALTKTDDTNVTLTLGGTPASALLAATSITVGWSGTLATTRMPALTGDVTTGSGTVATTIAANAVTNAKAAQMATNTLKGNNTGSTANALDLTAAQVCALLGIAIAPTGRLTLTSGTAVMTSDVASAATVYYTGSMFIPLYNGTSLVMTATGGELLQATTDATKSPAAVANNSNYDIFVWSDSGTMRATRGPAWTSDTGRGTGAGTTELDFTTTPGFPLNKNAITNGPAALRGTYVGTIRSNGTATIDQKFGTAGSGGGAAIYGIWNTFNRVSGTSNVTDTTATWTYTSATIRSANASTGNRVSFVSGLATDSISAFNQEEPSLPAVAGSFAGFGLSLDATTNLDFFNFIMNQQAVNTPTGVGTAYGTYKPQLGFHFIQATEKANGTNAVTFNGGVANQVFGVTLQW